MSIYVRERERERVCCEWVRIEREGERWKRERTKQNGKREKGRKREG